MTVIPQPPSALGVRGERWRRHALAFVAVAAVVLLAGLYVAFLAIPNQYEAETVLTAPRTDRPARDYVAEITLSTVLASAAERLGVTTPNASTTVREAAAGDLGARLTVYALSVPSGDTEIHLVTRGRDARALAGLVNVVAQVYVSECDARNRSAQQKIQELAATVSRLKAGLGEVTPMVESARAALKDFESQHAEAITDAGSSPDAAMKALTDEETKAASDYEKTQAEVVGLEGGEKLLRARLAEVPELVETKEVTTVRNPELVALDREIRQMEKQLEDLLRIYTFRHPDVIALQTDLLLKKRQLRQLKERVEDSVKSSKSQNPEYALLKGKLDDTVMKLQVAKSSLTPIANRRQSLVARLEALRAFVEPHRRLKGRLTEVEKLQQDNLALLKTKSDELKEAQGALEPVPQVSRAAEPPVRPVGPRRALYAVLAALAAVAAGWMSMSAAYRLSPGFAGPAEVEAFAGAPVVGRVSAAKDTEAEDAEQLKARIYLATTLGIVAIVVGASLVMAHFSGR